MSGFEIAGLILGSYPFLVTALAVYKETRSGQGARRLVQNLTTEETVFYNFLFRLLAPPIISEADFARLTNPACPDLNLWKDAKLEKKLEDRLGRKNADAVVGILKEIHRLLSWLRDELKFNDHGLVKKPLRRARIFFTLHD